MREPDPLPPAAHESAPRPAQPWSDAGRRVHHAERTRKAGRRRQLERFNDGLATIVLREMEEEQSVVGILNVILKLVWAPLMFAGAAVLYRYTRGSGFTVTELALGLSCSIVLGLSLGQLHHELRGDTTTATAEPDPYGAAQDEVGFTTLGLGDASFGDDDRHTNEESSSRDARDTGNT